MFLCEHKHIRRFSNLHQYTFEGNEQNFEKRECQKGGIKHNGGWDPCAHDGAVEINKGGGSQNKWGRGSDKSQKNNRGKGEERAVRILES